MFCIKKALLYILVLGVIYIPAIPVAKATGPISYSYSYTDQGRHNTYTRYFPLNSNSQFVTYPYAITVSWNFKVGSHPDGHEENDAWFRIEYCLPNGSTYQSVVFQQFHSNSAAGSFNLPANTGILVTLETGHWDDYIDPWHTKHYGYDCWYTISYQLDETPPNQPPAPTVDPSYGYVSPTISGKICTNSDTVLLKWNPVPDTGMGVAYQYSLSIAKDGVTYDSGWFGGTQYNLANLGLGQEGEYRIKLKARDYENNQSPYSPELILLVDKTAPVVAPQRTINN